MSHETVDTNMQPLQPRDSIDNLLLTAKQEGHTIAEIKVWETGSVSVPQGDVGVAATAELNGCHASIFVTPDEGGDTMTVAHFPPYLGRKRYGEFLAGYNSSLQERGIRPKAIVMLTASDRPSEEDSWASETFPETPVHYVSYKASDAGRRSRPDAGKCMAVLDRREQASVLHVLTDSGDKTIAL